MFTKAAILCLVSLSVMFEGTINNCLAETGGDLNQTKDNILTLIENGNYAQAESDTNKLSENYAGHPDLPETLYWIGEKYAWAPKYEESKRIYKQVIQNYPNSSWASKARLSNARADIISFILSGKYDQANSDFNKMVVGFAQNPDLPETLYWIGQQYGWSARFEDANNAYQQIVQKYPQSPWASKAKLNISREQILSFIAGQNYSKAQAAVDKLKTDLAGHPDLPETLYRIGEQYEWAYKYEESKQFYQQVIQNASESFWAGKARLSIARADIMALITSEDYDKSNNALNKMMVDFAGDPNLPETVYWIAEKYKWSNRPDESSRICSLIIRKYPRSRCVDKARFGISRADALSLSMAQDYDNAQKALDKLGVDFAGNSGLPEALYLVAEKYKWSYNFAEAKKVYQQVIQKDANSVWASNAKFAIAHSDIMLLVISGNYDQAEESLNKLAADFAGHPDLPRLTMVIGEQFYKEGLAKDSNGFAEEAKGFYERSVKVFNGLINTDPNSDLLPDLYYWTGDCYRRLNKYEDSLRCFQRVADNYPTYKYAWHALFMVGCNYESLSKSGIVPKSEADPKIRAAYTQLIEKYPSCPEADFARNKMNSK